MKKESKLMKGLLIVIALVAGLLGGAALHAALAEPVKVPTPVPVPGPVEYVNVTVPGPVVEKIVTKDVKVFDLALAQYVLDNDGKVEHLVEDLDESEVAKIGDRAVFVTDLKMLAVDAVKSDIADLVDMEVVANVSLDEDDVERVRVKDDADEILVKDIDFDDKDATLVVFGTFEHEDLKYKYEAEVSFKDGKFDETELVEVELA